MRDAESQLTQRTAELEAANTLLYKKNCALGRAETSINDLQAELERVRSLVEALPKVEGDWTVSCALAVTVVTGGIVRDISEVVAAIVQHRQGMEG
jgi:Tfp pilus assembly protein PilX